MGVPILVIEDDDVLRNPLRDWLETIFRQCDVILGQADDGPLPLAEAHPPSAILIHVDPLGRHGAELIRRLKVAVPDADIIALTLDDHEALRQDVRAAGAAACVSLYELHDQLLPMLRRVVDPAYRAASKTWTVLCIEDELETIKLIDLTLERGPFRVVGAFSGRQGLEVARTVNPDVVLLDLMMPDMDGVEVYRRMKADEALRDVPIVVVSVVQPSSARARDLEVEDFIRKPFDAEDLRRRVRKVVDPVVVGREKRR